MFTKQKIIRFAIRAYKNQGLRERKVGSIREQRLVMEPTLVYSEIFIISINTISDLGVLSNLIGSLSLANEHYSPPTE